MIPRVPCLLLLACSIAAAQGRAQASRLDGRLDSFSRDQIDRVVDSAGREGLPVEPLLDKAREGAAKRADGPRIVAAVRALAMGLRASRAALGSSTLEPDVVAGAEALRVGVERRSLAELRAARRDQSLLVPLAALSDLIARGVPADTAAAAVLRLARRGASDAEFDALERAVEQDISTGASPATAASVRASAGSEAADHAGGSHASNDGGRSGNAADGIADGGGADGQQGGGPGNTGPGRGQGVTGGGPTGAGNHGTATPAGEHPPRAHAPKDKPPKGKDRPPKSKPPKNKSQPAQPPKHK